MSRRREEMVMRSDFKQKLLNDLRLRKERMGLVPPGERSSSPAAAAAAGGYKNSRWSFRGSGEATASNFNSRNISDINTAKIWLNRHQAPSLESGSQEIVPFGKNKTREHTVDLSMALALALSNSGKLQNMGNSKMGRKIVLHMDDNMTRSNAYQFYISPSQIGEIERGVQNLNMILKACSNGFSFSSDSIDIGRELLKGAMDLEESLKMLATLQDASDYMVGSKGKQRSKLLKEEEDESPPRRGNQRNAGSRIKFSFIRDVHSAERVEQKQKAASYNEKSRYAVTNSNNSSSKSSTEFLSHCRYISCGPSFKSESPGSSHGNHELERFLNDGTSNSRNNQVSSKANPASEKARIPNVIAKLMGLEELATPMEAKTTETNKGSRSLQVQEISKLVEVDQAVSKKEVNMTTSSNKRIIKVDAQEKVLPEKGMNDILKNNFKRRNIQKKTSASNDTQKAYVRSNMQMGVNNMDHNCETRERKMEAVSQEETPIMKQQIKGRIEHNVPAVQKSLPDLTNDTRIKKKEVKVGREESLARKQQTTEKIEHIVDSNYEQQCTLSISDVKRDSNNSKKELVQREELVLQQQRDAQVKTNVFYQSNNERNNEPAQQPAVHSMQSSQGIQETCKGKEPDAKGKLQLYVANQRDMKSKDMEIHPQRMRTRRMQFNKESANSSAKSLKNKTGSQSPKENSKINHNGKPNIKNKTTCNHHIDKKFIEQSLKERLPLKRDTGGEKKAIVSTQAAAIRKPMQIQSAQQVNVLKVREGDANRSSVEIPAQNKVLGASQSMELKSSILEELEYRWKGRNKKMEGAGKGSEAILDLNLQQGAKFTTPANLSVEDENIKVTTYNPVVSEEAKTDTCSNLLKGDENMQTSAAQSTQEIYVKSENENSASQHTDSSCDTMTTPIDLRFQENSLVKYPEPQSRMNESRDKDPSRTAQLNSSKSIGCQERTTMEVDQEEELTKGEGTLKQMVENEISASQLAQSSYITVTTPANESSQENFTVKYAESYSMLKENKKVRSRTTQLNNSKSRGCQKWATMERDRQEALTKDEETLKQILTKSQNFLNIAQANFQIKIPVDILQATESASQDKDTRLVDDCGCELVGRKGKIEEHSFSRKTFLAPLERTSLDTLIKEVNGDLENLNYINYSERFDYNLANGLNKMIENDIKNRNPNINALWEFGWDSITFACLEQHEIVRDVEKHVLNGLVNELAKDLLNVSISAH